MGFHRQVAVRSPRGRRRGCCYGTLTIPLHIGATPVQGDTRRGATPTPCRSAPGAAAGLARLRTSSPGVRGPLGGAGGRPGVLRQRHGFRRPFAAPPGLRSHLRGRPSIPQAGAEERHRQLAQRLPAATSRPLPPQLSPPAKNLLLAGPWARLSPPRGGYKTPCSLRAASRGRNTRSLRVLSLLYYYFII